MVSRIRELSGYRKRDSNRLQNICVAKYERKIDYYTSVTVIT
jgi:hypothetical protein